jgi:hypothetical protein
MAFTIAQFNIPEPLPGCPFTPASVLLQVVERRTLGNCGFRISDCGFGKTSLHADSSNPQAAIRNLQSGWGL